MKSYKEVFLSVFGPSVVDNIEELEYQQVPQWDSIGHMSLIAAIESNFSIQLDVDDVIDFSSYKVGAEIVAKYGVTIAE